MNTPATATNIAAGATAVTISAGQSLSDDRAASLYRATIPQIVNGQFDLVLSDVLGLLSIAVLLVNLGFTVRRERKKRGQ